MPLSMTLFSSGGSTGIVPINQKAMCNAGFVLIPDIQVITANVSYMNKDGSINGTFHQTLQVN